MKLSWQNWTSSMSESPQEFIHINCLKNRPSTLMSLLEYNYMYENENKQQIKQQINSDNEKKNKIKNIIL